MCTVNIQVDDALMRRINPELTSPDRINQWLQNQVDELIGRMTLHHLSPNAHSAEEMRSILSDRIRRAEAGEEEFLPNNIVCDTMSKKYGF